MRRLRRRKLKIYLYLFLFFFVVFLIIKLPSFITYLAVTARQKVFTHYYSENKKGSLKESVATILSGAKATYGVVIKNLKTGETYYVNEHKPFNTASLYKVWLMSVVYEQIQQGKLKENQVLSKDAKVLNAEFNVASESADQAEGKVTFAVDDALEKTIIYSTNNTALLLTDAIGLSSVKAFLQRNSLYESSGGELKKLPMSTPYDMSLFFEKLYSNQLADKQYTTKMVSLLQKQQLNDVIPKLLPQNILIAHKTGDLESVSHDAGIVFSPSGDYIIVLMSDSELPSEAKERMAKISKAVYDYFEQDNKIREESDKLKFLEKVKF